MFTSIIATASIHAGLLFAQIAAPTPAAPAKPAGDRFVITLPSGADESLQIKDGNGGAGRLILFFIKDGGRGPRGDPMDAPFYSKPQPLASIEVSSWKPGDSITIDGSSLAWPDPVDSLDGIYRVQAVFRRNTEGHSHKSVGNIHTDVKTVELGGDRDDTVELAFNQVFDDEKPAERANLKWFRMKSEILSKALGRETYMEAGLAFPREYDLLDAPRRFWPAIYVVPGFGGDETMADHYASMLLTPGTEAIAPQAVYVVLDPDGRFGHHGFADSANNGPRGEALVKELIPALEKRFRLVAKPEARLVTGHSSGGWSSLWLQLTYPDVFGACFSSAPDPVDFSAFQLSDLYQDTDLFTDDEGREEASFRQPLGPNDDRVMMTVREEIGVEHVLGPHGDSGEQWGAWNAMFSPKDPKTGFPKRMFDPVTGAVRRAVVEETWSTYDIAKRTEREWMTLGPVFAQKVHLVCGDRDSYYLNRAVERLRDKIEALKDKDAKAGHAYPSGGGYIELVPRATHETIVPLTTIRFNKEMIEHLRRYGLHQ